MNKCKICELKSPTRNDKCDIKYGNNKQSMVNSKDWIPFNKNSWDSYDDFKHWQYNYDRKKVKCEICGKAMIRTSIYDIENYIND